jgi:NADH-quinone oxidoreductase subunit K
MFLIVSLMGVAGLYLLQQAEFLFAVQIVLYIGGIMVLFLFVIMLVNLDQAAKEKQFNGQWWIALVCVAVVGVQVFWFLRKGGAAFKIAQPGMMPAASAWEIPSNWPTFVHRLSAAVRDRFHPAVGGGGGFGGDGQETDLRMYPITTAHYIALSAALLLIGTVGVLTRRNIVIILMSIELILNAVNINLVAFSQALHNLNGQVFAIFVITDAVAEAAVGLGILIALFRNKETVLADEVDLLKW